MPYTHPHSKTPRRNVFLGRTTPTEPPRYKTTPVGTIGGYQVEQCLGDCNTVANRKEYPYFGREVNGELVLYLADGSSAARQVAAVPTRRVVAQSAPPGLTFGNWIRPQTTASNVGFGFGSEIKSLSGGTKRRRRRNHSHRRRRSGSRSRSRRH